MKLKIEKEKISFHEDLQFLTLPFEKKTFRKKTSKIFDGNSALKPSVESLFVNICPSKVLLHQAYPSHNPQS